MQLLERLGGDLTTCTKQSKHLFTEIQKMMAIMLMKCSLEDHFILVLQAGRVLVGRDCIEGGLFQRRLMAAEGLVLTL